MQPLRNKKRICFISEVLSVPFDEGMKNVAFSLYKQLNEVAHVLIITNTDNDTGNLDITKVRLNKLFLTMKLRNLIKTFSPDIIIYLPEASATFNSFLRAKVLKIMNRSCKVAIIGTQSRSYSFVQGRLISSILNPDILFLLGKSDLEYFRNLGVRVKVLPPAVDCDRFHPISSHEKNKIRVRYNIPFDKKIALHVGHIKTGRNIECLIEMQEIENLQVVIIGSTSTKQDEILKERLKKTGAIIIDKFIENIQEIYEMSDIYVFPVISSKDAIDMPLSVLEAMACGLPIITTRFRALTDHFEESRGFRYFDNIYELNEIVENLLMEDKYVNHEKVKRFSWNNFMNEIISEFNGSI